MSFLRSVSRASKGATCAITMALLAMSSADAQTVIIDDSFADGITSLAPDQLNWNVTSSPLALDLDQAPGPVDFASGDSSRGVHATFPAQTLVDFGDVLTLTFDFTTPTSISYDGGTNGVTGSGTLGDREDFRFALFNTAPAAGMIDPNTGVAIDFNGPVESSSSILNPGLAAIPGFVGEIDDINRDNMDGGVDPVTGEIIPATGTDLGLRTHNINNDLSNGFATGRLFGTTSGFDFIAGGDDLVVSILPNSNYRGTLRAAFTDATLTALDITVGMEALDGSFVDSFTRSVPIADDPGVSVGVNTTTFDLFALGATSGAFGGTVGPTVGSSTVGEDNNGIDISNVTITFTDFSEMGALKGDVDLSGEVDLFDISPFIAILTTPGSFQAEADVDCNGEVNLFDIAPFIAILTMTP